MSAARVVTLRELGHSGVSELCARYGARLTLAADGAPIPATYWGEPEAGLDGDGLHARLDTPVHSVLHELGHFVCAPAERRRRLERDAGGSVEEECAVCYLEVALADELTGYGAARCLADMDAWGYTFREGSAAAWHAGDGRDARDWLVRRGLLDAGGRPSWRLND